MKTYDEFYTLLNDNRLLSNIWKEVLNLLKEDINDDEDQYLSLLAIFFSLVDDGNICMSLNEDILIDKWMNKVNSTEVMLLESEDYNKDDFIQIKERSIEVIKSHLSKININNLPSLIGKGRVFEIEDNYLYIKKYNDARKSIKDSISRLFVFDKYDNDTFDYKKCVDTSRFALSNKQEEAVIKGVNRNIIVTGSPGTGKTTSILFLLYSLLNKNINLEVHLCAPSGKASARMKESIIGGLSVISDDYKSSHQEVTDKIVNLKESTIHSLLHIDNVTHAFSYNKNNQFNENSIFIIDEASMVDICLFASLLEAIKRGSRIFIMGDENQLPSVECGAVFTELLKLESTLLNGHIVRLDESKRFKSNTEIFSLATAVNNGDVLPIKLEQWEDYDTFSIRQLDKSEDDVINDMGFDFVKVDKDNCPIYYYKNYKDDDKVKEIDIVKKIVLIWGKRFYRDLQEKATDVDPNNLKYLETLFRYSEQSKILSAENEGSRGVKMINDLIKRGFIKDSRGLKVRFNNYPGQVMMINKNNQLLDLYNGDSGITIKFKDDDHLYLMVKKKSKLVSADGKIEDQIFKLGDYTFYPLRMISSNDIDLAYAITIHKSQGSDYPNILVITPTKKGHPLLNRQIIYTAITRTKGYTYILSNQDRLDEAKDTVIKRDTNIA